MNALPHVVIVGAGFGGLTAAQKLAAAPVRVTLIDRRNYHLFQPLLYQVAIAGLTPAQIAYPLRAIFRRQKNIDVLMEAVTGVDLRARKVRTASRELEYDHLILAAGSRTNFFGMRSIQEHAHELKDIASAIATRNHLLRVFEQASQALDPAERRACLTFVIVGGGPTGVETAGMLSELIHLVLRKDYPQMDLRDARVILVEASSHLMPDVYPRDLQAATLRLLRRKGVSVRLRMKVTGYDGEQVSIDSDEPIAARTLIWTAGVQAEGLAGKVPGEKGRGGRIPVKPGLQLAGYPEVYVIGDSAYVEDAAGQPLPLLATVAQQQAQRAVENLKRALRGLPPEPFVYKDPGLLATIGRNAAVARLWGVSFSGLPAWLIWVALHIYRLIGFRNRLAVMLNWAWDYLFYDSQARLITEE